MYTDATRTIDRPAEPAVVRVVCQLTRFALLPVLLVLLLLQHTADAQSKVQQIAALVRTAHAHGQLNGAVLVSEQGRIIYSKAFGYADFDRQTPLRTDSVFELALGL